MYEKILNIIRHQRRVHRNHNEASLPTQWDGDQKARQTVTRADEDVGEMEPSHTAAGGCHSAAALENGQAAPQKGAAIRPSNFTAKRICQDNLNPASTQNPHTHVHRSVIRNSQKGGRTRVFID